MKTYQQYIDGKFQDSHSKDMIQVLNPYTEQVIAHAPNGDAEDAAKALAAAEKAQGPWAARTASDRASYLKKMAAAIRANREELAKTLAEEQAKIIGLAQVEIDVTADYFDYYAGWATKYEGEVIQSDRPGENILLLHQPIGIVVGICPWNFPFFVMDIPGVRREDLKIDINENEMLVTGRAGQAASDKETFLEVQFGPGEYVRAVSLSDLVDRERIKASLKDGVLTIHLPRLEKAAPRRIPVQSA